MVELSPAVPADQTFLKLGFAGDTANTAWYLARLRPDWEVTYLTDVGNDDPSQRMIAFLQKSGINTTQIIRHKDATVGLYLIQLDANGERSFIYWRAQSAARRLAEDPARLHQAVCEADLVYFSGITLAILRPECRSRFIDAVARASDDGKIVVYDPNLRPRLWEDAGTMRCAVMQAAQVASVVLPSFEDEAAAIGDADPEATLKSGVGVPPV